MKKRYHLAFNIEGLLANYKRKKIDFMLHDDGRRMTDAEAKHYLAEVQAQGWKVLSVSDCDGFDHFGGGCPGHPVDESKQNLK